MLSAILSILDNIWQYNIVNISGNNIAVNNIVLSFSIAIVGLKYYKRFILFISDLCRSHISLEKTNLYILEKIIFYITSSLYILLMLQVANVPLSIFAFIGSSLALSVGLGAQGFIGNLISGLIILFEGNLSLNDVIETEGIKGTIIAIKERCVILEVNNNNVIIPNSKLLQSSLINCGKGNGFISFSKEIIFLLKDKQGKIKNSKKDDSIAEPDEISTIVEKIENELKSVIDKTNLVFPTLYNKILLTKIGKNTVTFMLQFSTQTNIAAKNEEVLHILNNNLLKSFKQRKFIIK